MELGALHDEFNEVAGPFTQLHFIGLRAIQNLKAEIRFTQVLPHPVFRVQLVQQSEKCTVDYTQLGAPHKYHAGRWRPG